MVSSALNFAIATFASLIFALHIPPTSATELLSLSPLRPPIFGDVCEQVSCGNGNCTVTNNSTVPFECVCDPGWKQPTSLTGFHFLPCIVPDCTIDTSCSGAPSPDASLINATKGSIFDPCSWNICGGGTCTKSSSNSSYSCSCSKGYQNLMNSVSLPCYPWCGSIGDCPVLDIPISSEFSPPSSTLNNTDNSTNLARSLQHEKLSRVISLVLLLLMSITILAENIHDFSTCCTYN